jgi:hypothetical protein
MLLIETQQVGSINADGGFQAASAAKWLSRLDPLLPHGCAVCSLESSQSRNSCARVVMRNSFDATQQPIALRS